MQLDSGKARKDTDPAADVLYRNIPHRAGSRDVATWKMCVPKALRETVLKENHNSPAAGQVGSQKTSGSPVLLARNAQRRPSPPARMRDMHETQAKSDAGCWENADAGGRGTMGYGMCHPARGKDGRPPGLHEPRGGYPGGACPSRSSAPTATSSRHDMRYHRSGRQHDNPRRYSSNHNRSNNPSNDPIRRSNSTAAHVIHSTRTFVAEGLR